MRVKNWTIEKCGCGHSACDKYLLSFAGADGRMEKEDAVLVAAAPIMLEALEEIMARCESRMAEDDAHYENYHEAKQAIAKATENGPPAAKHEGP